MIRSSPAQILTAKIGSHPLESASEIHLVHLSVNPPFYDACGPDEKIRPLFEKISMKTDHHTSAEDSPKDTMMSADLYPCSSLSRGKTERSVGSTLCSIERDSPEARSDIKSLPRPFRFRPRFADEGLEDLDDEDDFSDPDDLSDFETPAAETSSDLRDCMKVSEEMERDREQRSQVLPSDLLRE